MARLGVGDNFFEQRFRVSQFEGKKGTTCLQGRQARDHVLGAALHVDAHDLVGTNARAPQVSREALRLPVELLVGQYASRVHDGRRPR